MRIVKFTAAFAAVLLLCLTGYETWRVSVARAATPELMKSALAHIDPEITHLSRSRIDMLVAVEDPTFWSNDGTDFFSPGAGMTTITQGLGKTLYFDPFKPGFRKIELILVSKFALSRQASKMEILQAAMNSAYFGDDSKGHVFGLAEASRRYYGRELSAIRDDDYLSLIAMLPAPSRLDPIRHRAANAERVARIKRLLAKACTPAMRDVMLDACAHPT